ncbi:UvrD-helicase domain-containing protein [uncultured Enterovirga sp.]|uniref:UvrD-helicase domain-containing protein n=1 Tax=uncultured Enterovirga sp. TaxID=2026352 RepID=UPI0035CB533E
MTLPDLENRRRALCDLNSTFLMEAAAGTGKTSLMAGRVALLLAEGHAPSSIAAITFTELAAGELDRKIRTTVAAVVAGRVPPALAGILPLEGLSPGRREALEAALLRLDELTATTIHGFCQAIIAAHGVEAGLDPGARVVDENVATAMFDQALSDFLSARLQGVDDPADPVSVLAKDDPLGIVERLRELAMLRREHPDANTPAPAPAPGARPDLVLSDAVATFTRWHASSPGDRAIADAIAELEALSASFSGSSEENLDFATLWSFAKPDRISLMRSSGLELKTSIEGAAWGRFPGEQRQRLEREAAAHLAAVDAAYRTLIGHIAQRLVSLLSGALSEVITRYTAIKRDAAVLDFDDLLRFASALVRREEIRQVLSTRFRHILVDEFQDTDGLQVDIVFRLAATGPAARWQDGTLRPGGLFLVGDPKQAIYSFRGADIEAYHEARDVIGRQQGGAVLPITSNFRSRKGIVEHVNLAFRAPFSQPEQPDYVAIEATAGAGDPALPHAAKLTVAPEGQARAAELREAEAVAVARVCKRLIGNVMVRRDDETLSPLKAGDIALLAPGHTDLWRYERALVAEGLAVASQAGKSFFARQETQDLLALCRTLSDPRDTVAFGALMRGPLVGLPDEDLLDIAAGLGSDGEGPRRFTVTTDPASVQHAEARAALEALQDLRRLVWRLTPSQLIATAVERLQVRVIVAVRHKSRSAPALANIDALIERARPYAVAGMRAFVRDLDHDWRAKLPTVEGRVDASEDAIDLVTMHSAKGLEWPVVIPVNSSTQFPSPKQFVHRRFDDTLHWMIGGIAPPELAAAREMDQRRKARERERLWYVSCTRARDLLIIPYLPDADKNSWSRVLDLGQAALPEFVTDVLPEKPPVRVPSPSNLQTVDRFAEEGKRVRAAVPTFTWWRPSEHDPDRAALIDAFVTSVEQPDPELAFPAGAGALRGTVIHKLMEEYLTGELDADEWASRLRARELLAQLASGSGTFALPDSVEMASTSLRTMALPEIAALRPYLVAEYPLWSPDGDRLLSGRGDALAIIAGVPSVVLDWKSDFAPTSSLRAQYADQVRAYMRATGAARGAVVYMTTGTMAWVDAAARG